MANPQSNSPFERLRQKPDFAAFKGNVGQPLSKEDLSYVAKIQEHPRRVRELNEDGWQILSNLDDPSLASGQYTLVSADQLPPRARQAIKLRFEILDRDGYRCVMCGTTAGRAEGYRYITFVQSPPEGTTRNRICGRCAMDATRVSTPSEYVTRTTSCSGPSLRCR